jgi:WASH complex subunit strumpellin
MMMQGVLMNQDGQQLLGEAVYLYGIMLFLLDQRIGGEVRERMLISYLRYKARTLMLTRSPRHTRGELIVVCGTHSRDMQGHTDLPLIDEVCKLCRSTGYAPGQPKPPKYPEDYFKRYRVLSLPPSS